MVSKTVHSAWATLALACSAFALQPAQAADTSNYPSRPVTVVIPAVPGGATDVVGRVMAEELGKRLGQSVVVDNKGGASGMVGTQAVAHAPADGHTLLVAYSTPVFYVHHIFPKVAYDIKKDFELITQITSTSLILMVNNEVPVNDMKEFMDWAQTNKGKVNYGSYGTGTAGHLMSAYLNDLHKLDMTHVAYKSETPHLNDLAGGVVPWGMGTLAASRALLKSGRIRPIAILGPNRLADLPDVPTMKEQGFSQPEFNTVAWFSLLAPAGTPKPIIERLEKEAVEIIHSPAMRARYQVFGMDEVEGGSANFHRAFDEVNPIIAKLVKISGAKAE